MLYLHSNDYRRILDTIPEETTPSARLMCALSFIEDTWRGVPEGHVFDTELSHMGAPTLAEWSKARASLDAERMASVERDVAALSKLLDAGKGDERKREERG